MIAHKVIFVTGEGFLDEAVLGQCFSQVAESMYGQKADPWRFAIVGKVKHMYHILCLFLLHDVPTLLR